MHYIIHVLLFFVTFGLHDMVLSIEMSPKRILLNSYPEMHIIIDIIPPLGLGCIDILCVAMVIRAKQTEKHVTDIFLLIHIKYKRYVSL